MNSKHVLRRCGKTGFTICTGDSRLEIRTSACVELMSQTGILQECVLFCLSNTQLKGLATLSKITDNLFRKLYSSAAKRESVRTCTVHVDSHKHTYLGFANQEGMIAIMFVLPQCLVTGHSRLDRNPCKNVRSLMILTTQTLATNTSSCRFTSSAWRQTMCCLFSGTGLYQCNLESSHG